jgi:hypothetical protein
LPPFALIQSQLVAKTMSKAIKAPIASAIVAPCERNFEWNELLGSSVIWIQFATLLQES